MRKLLSKIRNFGAAAISRVKIMLIGILITITHTRLVLASNKGEGFVDTAVKILIAVVIGALVLAGCICCLTLLLCLQSHSESQKCSTTEIKQYLL